MKIMDLSDLYIEGTIVKQPTSREEIQELLRLAARSMSDACISGLSTNGKFKLAYEAALQLSSIPLRCAGYRSRGGSHHWSVFHVLPEVMGEEAVEIADYFQACRGKRSAATYHRASVVTEAESNELVREVEEFDRLLRRWLRSNYPEYA